MISSTDMYVIMYETCRAQVKYIYVEFTFLRKLANPTKE